MIPTGHRGPTSGRRLDRAVSPALGFAVALIVTVVLAIAVGVLVGTIAEDPEPNTDFEWTQSGQGTNLEVTLEHAGGDSIPGERLRLEASGIRGLTGNTSLADWGTVRNGSTLTVGFVADADVEARRPYRSDGDLEGRSINGTDTETGVDVIAVAVEGRPLENGTVLVSSMDDDAVGDVPMDDLRDLRLVWYGSWGEAELDAHVIDR